MFHKRFILVPCLAMTLTGCDNTATPSVTVNSSTPKSNLSHRTASTDYASEYVRTRRRQPPKEIDYSNPSPEDLQLLVQQARDYYRRNGEFQALNDFMNPSSNFVAGRTYFFVFDYNGKCLADWGKPALVGTNTGHERFYALASQQARHGGGWINTIWQDPITGVMRDKSCYVMDIDGNVFIGSGVYQ